MENSNVIVKVSFWKRDFFGLFDYHSDKLKTQGDFILNETCCIWGSESSVEYSEEGAPAPKLGLSPLITLIHSNSQVLVQQPDSSAQELWVPIRKTKKKGAKLSEGSVIKLGRRVLRVLEISLTETPIDTNSTEGAPSEGFVCKICMEDAELEDSLMQPCSRCANTRVHLMCFRQWIAKDTIVKKRTNSTIYRNAKYLCDVCRETLPVRIQAQNGFYYLFDIEIPTSPYLILESLELDNHEKRLYIVNLQKNKKLTMGSSRKCDLRMKDFTIEKLHATLETANNEILLTDKKSKYGTMIRPELPLQLQDSLAVQSGRALISLQFPSKANLFRSLFSKSTSRFY